MSSICEKDFSKIPEKYKCASDKKIAKKLKKMPPPIANKKELVIETPRGRVVI